MACRECSTALRTASWMNREPALTGWGWQLRPRSPMHKKETARHSMYLLLQIKTKYRRDIKKNFHHCLLRAGESRGKSEWRLERKENRGRSLRKRKAVWTQGLPGGTAHLTAVREFHTAEVFQCIDGPISVCLLVCSFGYFLLFVGIKRSIIFWHPIST